LFVNSVFSLVGKRKILSKYSKVRASSLLTSAWSRTSASFSPEPSSKWTLLPSPPPPLSEEVDEKRAKKEVEVEVDDDDVAAEEDRRRRASAVAAECRSAAIFRRLWCFRCLVRSRLRA
jgi:hypothetical protein